LEDKEKRPGFSTLAVHAGQHPDPITGCITTPIYQTSTFVFENAAQGAARFAKEEDGFIYTRLGNPTLMALEENIAALEGGDRGFVFASGMAAIHGAVLALVKAGDHMVATDSIYGGTFVQFNTVLPREGISTSFVDSSDVREVEKGLTKKTKVIFIETPANPTMKLSDIRAICELAHGSDIRVIVDNTFMSPYFQHPLEHGADVVVHSLTKYLGGHSDIIGGVVVTSNEIAPKVRHILDNTGATLDPLAAWLVLRGIKTLPIRMDRHNSNAKKVVQFLKEHPKVKEVFYPGLEEHPQHELAKKQMSGFGGMISFEVEGGLEAGQKIMNNVKLCALAVSLGAVETLIQHPASMTHAGIPKEDRLASGITDGLVRISVGIEDPEDIIADLKQAMENV